MRTHVAMVCLVLTAWLLAAGYAAAETPGAPEGGRPVSMIIFVESPIRSSGDYYHQYWNNGLDTLDPAKHVIELEVRTADNTRQVARVPRIIHPGIYPGNVLKLGGIGGDKLSDAQKLWMGELPDGEYLAAVMIDGKRVSNVARFVVDKDFDPKKEPTLALTPLPLAPGQTTPCLGITVVGPDPADPVLDYMHIFYPGLVVDGILHEAHPGGWAGANEVIKPGQRYLHLLTNLDLYKIGNPSGTHRVKAVIGEHESAEVTIPAGNDLDRLWDASTPGVAKLSYEQALESASKPMIVTGTVTDSAGAPVEGVIIRATTSSDPTPVETARVKSGADGRYTLRFGAKKGQVVDSFSQQAVISASKDGFYDRDFLDHGVFQITNLSAVQPGPEETATYLRPFAPFTLNFTMLAAATIKGRVVDAKGKPLAGRQVQAQCRVKEGSAPVLASAKTDKEGRFVLRDVPAIDVFMRIYLPDDSQFVSDLLDLEKPGAYELEFVWDEAKSDVSMRVISQPGEGAAKASGPKLKVIVTDETGRPADRVDFTLWRAVDPKPEVANPDRDDWRVDQWVESAAGIAWEPFMHSGVSGECVIDKGLARGFYRVTAARLLDSTSCEMTAFGRSEPVFVDGLDSTATASIQLEAGTPVVVKTTDATTGKPVAAEVLLVRSDGMPMGCGDQGWIEGTGEKGALRYGAFPKGAYTLRVRARACRYGDTGYADYQRDIVVGAAGPDGQIIDVALSPATLSQAEIEKRWPFVVEGVVTDANGKAMPGVKVTAAAGGGTLFDVGSTTTDKDGAYSLRFTGGIWEEGKDGETTVRSQMLAVGAAKDGLHQKNPREQGYLMMTSNAENPTEGGLQWPLSKIVAPGKPYRIDFVMIPNETGTVQAGAPAQTH